MKTITIVLIFLALFGCASQFTPEEIAERRQIATENWEMCKLIINQANDMFIWVDHIHNDRRQESIFDVRSDLRSNQCVLRLGKYWIRNPEKEKEE